MSRQANRYEYDEEGQLTSASYRAEDPAGTAWPARRRDIFQYDALGNREGSNSLASRGTLTFPRRNNGLNQYAGWMPYSPILYDDPALPARGNGVLAENGWISATYNALNQPMGMWSLMYGSTNNLWFGYDPLGRCVKRWVGPDNQPPANTNPATYYYYEGWNLIQEGPSGAAAERTYVHGGRVDEMVASQAGGVWNYHQYDARGHCTLLTDTSGGIREQYDYDAFGWPYHYNAAGIKLSASGQWGNRFLFTGREWLRDLRVYDYRNRMYHPELGRFLQPDPKHFGAGDYNLYRYCHNDPVNRSDPFGLVDLSYTPEDAPNAGLRAWEATYNNPRAYDVAGHGDRNNMFDKNMKPITPQQVAKDIVSDKKNYKPGDPINLISCETGKDGKGSFGERLSKEMKKLTGKETKVTAPQKEVGPKLDKGGNIVPGSKPQQPGIDIWRKFRER